MEIREEVDAALNGQREAMANSMNLGTLLLLAGKLQVAHRMCIAEADDQELHFRRCVWLPLLDSS